MRNACGAKIRRKKEEAVRRYRRRQARKTALRLLALFLAGMLLAAGGSRLVLALRGSGQQDTRVRVRTRKPGERYTVAVDSGHGGTDTGAQGIVAETLVTQTTTQLLLNLLEQDPAYSPLQIHTPEQSPTPQERAQLARQSNAELFLSLHANKDTSAASNGFECFAVPPGHAYHTESLALARQIVAEMQAAGARIRGDTGIRYAYYKNGAKLIKEASWEKVYSYPTFGVLQDASCPAVLVEQCFISNPEDYAAWGTQEGCAAAAYCYYRAICSYFGTQPLPQN